MVKKYAELYVQARRELMAVENTQRAEMIAKELICAASGLKHTELIAHRDHYASQDVCQTFRGYLDRAVAGEPLAYILGEWDFFGMTLVVTPDVLIPRDDTCALAELAIEQAVQLKEDPRILDLCTGSGCVGLAIAQKVKDSRVTLADISREALAVAKKNAANLRLNGRVGCVHADALGDPPAFLGTFDMIVSNPPYIRTEEMGELEPSVRDFEPHLALDGGLDGLDFYRSIIENYTKALKPEGLIALEFGMGQGDDVCRLLEAKGFEILTRKKDFGGIERAVIARKTQEGR